MSVWPRVREAIGKGDVDVLQEVLDALDDAGRKEVAVELPRHLRTLSAWQPWRDWVTPLWVAGVMTINGAAATASWLCRREFAGAMNDVEPVLRAFARGDAGRRAAVAVRVANRLRRPTDHFAKLALELLRSSGAEPPADHDPLVVAWVSRGADRLRDDPLREALLPRFFEAEGVGRELTHDHRWPVALAALPGGDRAALLDGCVRRLLRGGTANDLRVFARLHAALAPAPHEAAPYARDYLALLPSAPGPVAELAVRQLKALPPLDPADLAEAVQALLFRPEGKLVKSGLTWLEQAVRHGGGSLDALAPALTMAMACESAEPSERAVALVLKHVHRFTGDGLERLREALPLLPPGLGADLAEAIGGEAVPGELDELEPVPLPAVEPARPFVFDPLEPGQLVTWRRYLPRWEQVERWLAELVRHASCGDLPTQAIHPPAIEGGWTGLDHWTDAILAGLCHGDWRPARLPTAVEVAPIDLLLLRRFHDVHEAARAGTLVPYLLATPTHDDGRLDPGVLSDRLEGYDRLGVRPMPADLEQALLRAGPSAIPPQGPVHGDGPRREWWPAYLPWHRETVAEHALATVRLSHWQDSDLDVAFGAALARAGGPGGPATARVMAGFVARATFRPVLDLAARGELHGRELGRGLAGVCLGLGLTEASAALRLEDLARRGAPHEAWQAAVGLLEALTEAGRSPTKVVELALRAARWTGARGEVPLVAAIAARKGNNTFLRTTRHLHQFLTWCTDGS
ncbi:hypothetical protein ACIBH1_28245 [Nonomuraea sp. NPDC050663]|uniref:hypothetical protein n=1 Tax=Nonomuraea sp. NPDC050663 TaxID=3364370 RepID=UPI00378D7640